MDELEVIMFQEVSDYREKFYGLTFRQWVFAVLCAATVIPTYIFLPKYTPINEDIASYIVIIFAGFFGFFGFVKINELDAEKIVPYWYRHYMLFGKPIEYMSEAEWEAAHQKKNKKGAPVITESAHVDGKIVDEVSDEKPALSKKQLKEQQKREKMLAKARAKYGYMFDEGKENVNDTVTDGKNDE